MNSVFSSTAAAPPPPPAGAATATAAADTPSSVSSVFTSCDSSRTEIPLMYSTTCCCVTSAIALLLKRPDPNPSTVEGPDLRALASPLLSLPRFFSASDSTVIRSRGTADNTVTNCCIGAWSTYSNLPYSSGLPGRFASSPTAAGVAARPCTTAPLMLIAGAVLANVVSALATATGSVAV